MKLTVSSMVPFSTAHSMDCNSNTLRAGYRGPVWICSPDGVPMAPLHTCAQTWGPIDQVYMPPYAEKLWSAVLSSVLLDNPSLCPVQQPSGLRTLHSLSQLMENRLLGVGTGICCG